MPVEIIPNHSKTSSCARCRRFDLWALLLALASITVVYWMGATFGTFIFREGLADSPYVLLAEAFLKGNLHVAITPDPELLKLSNPYDPIERGAIWYPWDLSLFNGKFFVYWGPVPVFLIYLPWRFLTGGYPEEHNVIFLLSLANVGMLSWLTYHGARRLGLPTCGPVAWWLLYIAFAGTFTVQLGGGVYVVAALSALFFQLLCLHLLIITATSPNKAKRYTFLAGLACILAVGSRFTHGLLIIPAVMLLGTLASRASVRVFLRNLSIFLIPVLAGGSLLMTYNYARFGSPFEVGGTYQLTVFDATQSSLCSFDSHFSFNRVARQIWYHFLSPMTFAEKFPFVTFVKLHPGFLADDPFYIGSDAVTGILPLSPLLAIGSLALPFAIYRAPRRATITILSIICLIGASTLFLSSCRFAATRYTFELYGPWLVISLWGVWSLLTFVRGPTLRALLGAVISCGMFASISIGVLATFSGNFSKGIQLEAALNSLAKRAMTTLGVRTEQPPTQK